MGLREAARLGIQRLASALPPVVRERLRRAIVRDDVPVRLDDWSLPLIPDRAPHPLVWPAPVATRAEVADETRIEPRPAPSPPVRCLLVTESLDASGMDEFVAFLARRLRERGMTVAVLLASDDRAKGIGPLGRDLLAEGLEVVDLGEAEGAGWVRSWRPDIVNVHGDATWPMTAARAFGAATVVTLHGLHDQMGSSARQIAERRRVVEGFIAVSESVRSGYLRMDPTVRPDRIVAIGNPVDPDRIRPYDRREVRRALGLTDADFLFLSLARHSLQKNAYGLVSAFSDVAKDEPRAHLLICGRIDDPRYARQVLGLRDRLGLSGQVSLRPNTPDADALLWAADVLVLDSFFEGWSLASMEALGTGLPVILSDVGGAREQLRDGPRRGILVSNPLGQSQDVTWEAISAARFRRQDNRDELVAAMRDTASRRIDFAPRPEIARYALSRYSADECADRHHATLMAYAAGGEG